MKEEIMTTEFIEKRLDEQWAYLIELEDRREGEAISEERYQELKRSALVVMNRFRTEKLHLLHIKKQQNEEEAKEPAKAT